MLLQTQILRNTNSRFSPFSAKGFRSRGKTYLPTVLELVLDCKWLSNKSRDLGQLSHLLRYKELLTLLKEYDAQWANAAKIRARVRWADALPISVDWSASELLIGSFTLWMSSLALPPLCWSLSRLFVHSIRSYSPRASTKTFSSDREEMVNNISKSLFPDEQDLCEGALSDEGCL